MINLSVELFKMASIWQQFYVHGVFDNMYISQELISKYYYVIPLQHLNIKSNPLEIVTLRTALNQGMNVFHLYQTYKLQASDLI